MTTEVTGNYIPTHATGPLALKSNEGLGPTPPMTLQGFFAEAKRLNMRVLGAPEDTRAALDLKDAEIARLRELVLAYAVCCGELSKGLEADDPLWDDLRALGERIPSAKEPDWRIGIEAGDVLGAGS